MVACLFENALTETFESLPDAWMPFELRALEVTSTVFHERIKAHDVMEILNVPTKSCLNVGRFRTSRYMAHTALGRDDIMNSAASTFCAEAICAQTLTQICFTSLRLLS